MKIILLGGAGFIGSCFAEHLSQEGHEITIIDNFSVGKRQFLDRIEDKKSFVVVECDARDQDKLTEIFCGKDLVMHFVANADISLSTKYPTLDFDLGVNTTISMLEAMRIAKVPNLIYFSGSGVYGDAGSTLLNETYAPLEPISMYGASKLAAESFICAYSHNFDIKARVFRMGNVVGPYQTHGVGYDFIQKLQNNQNKLQILGNGLQSKTYIHVDDVIKGVLLAFESKLDTCYDVFNLSSSDWITVNEIADICTNVLQLNDVEYEHTGGSVGWKGDVAKVRLDSSKLESLGWNIPESSADAIRRSIVQMKNNRPWDLE